MKSSFFRPVRKDEEHDCFGIWGYRIWNVHIPTFGCDTPYKAIWRPGLPRIKQKYVHCHLPLP